MFSMAYGSFTLNIFSNYISYPEISTSSFQIHDSPIANTTKIFFSSNFSLQMGPLTSLNYFNGLMFSPYVTNRVNCFMGLCWLCILRDALHLEAGPICYWNPAIWLDKRLKSSLVIGQRLKLCNRPLDVKRP